MVVDKALVLAAGLERIGNLMALFDETAKFCRLPVCGR
jgi:hypothetical protein